MTRSRLALLVLLMSAPAHTAGAQQREAAPVTWHAVSTPFTGVLGVEGMTRVKEEGAFRWTYTITLMNQGAIGITLTRVEESRWVTAGAAVAIVEEREIRLRIEPFGAALYEAEDRLAGAGKAQRTFTGKDDAGGVVRVEVIVDLHLEAIAVPRSPDAPPRPSTPPPAVTRIPIHPGGTAPIVVGGTVNGLRPVTLILDTGASYTILSPRVFHQLGLSIPSSAPMVQFVIAGGQRVEAPLVSVDSLEIGHSRVGPIEVLAYDAIPHDPALDGLIGLNFLNRFTITIDRGAGVLTIAPKSSER